MTVSITKDEFAIINDALILMYSQIKKAKNIREFEKEKIQKIKKAINKIFNAKYKSECPKLYSWYDYAKILDEGDICEKLSSEDTIKSPKAGIMAC